MNNTSQRIKLLRHMAKGNSVTGLQAFYLCETLSCSQRMGELKREGWPVDSKLIRVGRKHFKQYFIPEAYAAKVRRALAAS